MKLPLAKKLAIIIAGTMAHIAGPGNANAAAAQPAAPRQIIPVGYASYPPLFLNEAKTLDPMDLARESWKGYLTKQPDAQGMTPGLTPTLRFHFDDRALPWPSLKHSVSDSGGNNVGAQAFLHEMFGQEKNDDAAETGEMAYLLGCTDPESGLDYIPDSLPRNCPIGGELARNVLLLYGQTKNPVLLEWARRTIKTLPRYAVIQDRPAVGKVAAFVQDAFNPSEALPVSASRDLTLGGWQCESDAAIARAFYEYYQATGDTNSLEFAAALENRFCHSESAHGDDGALRPDGSFGGISQQSSGSWHMHGHTLGLSYLVRVGEELVKTGQPDRGIKFITQAGRTMDWLYDPVHNPDAGSLTGWLGEWLMVATGWPRKTDCEGCTMGDVTQAACALAAASQSDPRLADLDRFYDRAEQIYSGEVVEQMFRLRPDYLAVVRDNLTKRVDRELTNSTPETRAKEVERRYAKAMSTGDRMVGQQLGLCGFPDWVNQLKSDLDPDLPGIHMQGCCADATIRASHAIWSQTVTGNEKETRVNLAFNRDSDLVRVVSCLPHRGEVDVFVKKSKRVLVRVPEWAPKEGVKAYVGEKAVAVKWDRNYVRFDKIKSGARLTVTYPLRIAEVKETVGGLDGTEYTERWRGNTIVSISPPGKWIPMFERPELENENVPQ
jgi:hypothetical protein